MFFVIITIKKCLISYIVKGKKKLRMLMFSGMNESFAIHIFYCVCRKNVRVTKFEIIFQSLIVKEVGKD